MQSESDTDGTNKSSGPRKLPKRKKVGTFESILIVDDSPDFRSLIRKFIKKEWPEAHIFEFDPSHQKRFEFNMLTRFQLVILDYDFGLTNESGLDWLESIDTIEPSKDRPAFIMITGKGSDELANKVLQLGADEYLSKEGLTRDECVNSIKRVLRLDQPALEITREEVPQRDEAVVQDHTVMLSNDEIAHIMSSAELAIAEEDAEGGSVHVEVLGYELTSRVAQGGMSEVYLARDTSDDTKAIVKIVKTEKMNEDVYLKRFIQEFTLISRLDHPNVVKIYDRAFELEYAYIVMEFYPCGDLSERIKTGISEMDALTYASQIASGLEAIHNLGVIHRDLKGGNILFRDDGTLSITDFGVAKVQDSNFALTVPGDVLGTPHYLSPEQIESEELDGRSDLYSLGVLFYEMLTGEKPFKASSLAEILEAHRYAPIPKLPDEFAHLQVLIDKTMTKKREDRYENAGAFIQAVNEFIKPE